MPSSHFADRLLDAIDQRQSPSVVAMDPVFENLPAELRESVCNTSIDGHVEAIRIFSTCVLNTIAPIVPCVKINSAYFERYYDAGVALYHQLVQTASALGLLVIGDVKRGDVGHTAEMYAKGQLAKPELSSLSSSHTPDAVTINGYFGLDGVKPFIDTACKDQRGLFVLVRTSNPSAAVIQDVQTVDGRKVHEVVAAEVARWADDPRTIGTRGYSSIGAVVATRNRDDAARLRSAMPKSIFLVPGYGAQGGTAEDFRLYFKSDGTGAIIAAGRSVIFAHERPEYLGQPWDRAVEDACRAFAKDVGRLISRV